MFRIFPNFSNQGRDRQNHDNEFESQAKREVLRQSRLSFNIAIGTTVASLGMTLFGVGLLYFDKITESALTTTSGTAASLTSVQFAQTKKNELQKLIQELDEENQA
jgi:hypothetical protein